MSRARRIALGGTALVLAAVVGFGLYWFEPWRLVTNTRVDEAAPIAGSQSPSAATPLPSAATTPSTPSSEPPAPALPSPTASVTGLPAAPATPPAPAAPRMGEFISYEHATSGTAAILEVSALERYIRIENLDTSDGPDLRVYLSPLEHTAGMHAFGDDAVELGQLKGNLGNQNYPIPAGVDLAEYRSVVIWCKRFAVAFGAAPLD